MNNSSAPGWAADVQCPLSDPLQFILMPTSYCLVLGVGLPGNVVALLVFCQSGRVRKAIRIYLLNLTVADILFNLTLPFWITYYLAKGHWSLPEVFCRLAGASYYLATYGAMAFMTLISLNRYCTVAKLELVLNHPQGATVSSAVAWFLCLACAVPSLAKRQTYQAENTSLKCFEQLSGQRTYAYAMVVVFSLSFLVVLGSYLSIMRILSSAARTCQGGHRRRARTMVLGMLLVFAICVAPYHVTLVPWVTAQKSCGPPSFLDHFHTASVALLSLNSCIDPLIYCFSVKRFRTDLWLMVQKAFRCGPLRSSPLPPAENQLPPNLRSSSLTSL